MEGFIVVVSDWSTMVIGLEFDGLEWWLTMDD